MLLGRYDTFQESIQQRNMWELLLDPRQVIICKVSMLLIKDERIS